MQHGLTSTLKKNRPIYGFCRWYFEEESDDVVIGSNPRPPERSASYNRPFEILSGSATEAVSVISLPEEVDCDTEYNLTLYTVQVKL